MSCTTNTLVEQLQAKRRAMTVPQLAKLLSVSRQHVYKLTAETRVPFFRIGGAIRFDPGVIAEWLAARGDGFFRPRMNPDRREHSEYAKKRDRAG